MIQCRISIFLPKPPRRFAFTFTEPMPTTNFARFFLLSPRPLRRNRKALNMIISRRWSSGRRHRSIPICTPDTSDEMGRLLEISELHLNAATCWVFYLGIGKRREETGVRFNQCSILHNKVGWWCMSFTEAECEIALVWLANLSCPRRELRISILGTLCPPLCLWHLWLQELPGFLRVPDRCSLDSSSIYVFLPSFVSKQLGRAASHLFCIGCMP